MQSMRTVTSKVFTLPFRTLKCLKWHYSTLRSMKNVAVLTEDGAFALFFRPHPREFAIQGKKNANARGSARGGAGRRWN